MGTIFGALLYGLPLSNGLISEFTLAGLSSSAGCKLFISSPETNEIEIRQTIQMTTAIFFFIAYITSDF
jgi:hypothetical protein